MMNPNQWVMPSHLARCLGALTDGPCRRCGAGWTCRCPNHKDRQASLTIGLSAETGAVLLCCHAGCPTSAVLASCGLSWRDLWPDGTNAPSDPPRSSWGQPEALPGRSRHPDWDALVVRHCSHPDVLARLDDLAIALGPAVSALALCLLSVGWKPAFQRGKVNTPAVWTWPERDDTGQAVGISTRNRSGEKRNMRGSRRGLVIPDDWMEHAGPIVLAEGMTDTAALASCGVAAIGRPSAGSLAVLPWLACLLGGVPSDREVTILADRDASGAGLAGAIALAAALQPQVGQTIRVALPPAGRKDAREALNALMRQHANRQDAGQAFLQSLIHHQPSQDEAASDQYPTSSATVGEGVNGEEVVADASVEVEYWSGGEGCSRLTEADRKLVLMAKGSGRVLVVPPQCNCWSCPGCCRRMGREHAEEFAPRLLALQQEAFIASVDDPQEWHRVRQRCYELRKKGKPPSWVKVTDSEGRATLFSSAALSKDAETVTPAVAAARLRQVLRALQPRGSARKWCEVVTWSADWKPAKKPSAWKSHGLVAGSPDQIAERLESMGVEVQSVGSDSVQGRTSQPDELGKRLGRRKSS